MLFDKAASVYFFEKYVNILALEMASPVNQHCANCIGALSFPIVSRLLQALTVCRTKWSAGSSRRGARSDGIKSIVDSADSSERSTHLLHSSSAVPAL